MARQQSGRFFLLVLIAILFVGALVTVPSSVANEHTLQLSQSPNETVIAPGEAVQVSVRFNATGYDAPGLDLNLSSDFNVTDRTTDGGFYRASKHQWVWIEGGLKMVSYTVVLEATDPNASYTLSMKGVATDPDTDEQVTVRNNVTLDATGGSSERSTTQTESPTSTATATTETAATSTETEATETVRTTTSTAGTGTTAAAITTTAGTTTPSTTTTSDGPSSNDTTSTDTVIQVDGSTTTAPTSPPTTTRSGSGPGGFPTVPLIAGLVLLVAGGGMLYLYRTN